MVLVFFFPRCSFESRPSPARGFFGNNVAFRRSVFERGPFPSGLPIHRGQNVTYSRLLDASGIRIARKPRARSVHAPPEGLRIALRRMFLTGRDSQKLGQLVPLPADQPFLGDYEPYGEPAGRARKLWLRLREIARQQPAMLFWLPLALPIAVACVSAFFAGALVERFSPRLG